jgi:hypothetical protein
MLASALVASLRCQEVVLKQDMRIVFIALVIVTIMFGAGSCFHYMR